MQAQRCFWVIGLVLAFYGHAAAAAIPSGQDVPLQAEFERRHIAYEQSRGSQVYRRSGHRDARWDDAAIEFLDACDRLTHIPPDSDTQMALAKRGEQIIALGCNDPLVHYGYGRLLDLLGWNDHARPYVKRATEELARFGYPASRQATAFKRLVNLYPEDSAEAAEAVASLAALLPAIAADPDLKRDRPLMVYVMYSLHKNLPRRYQKQFVDAAKAAPGLDPVVLHAVEGFYHVQAAWLARGSGWAHTVTEEGWRGFAHHLEAAREALTRAWELDPTIPEVPRSLITVCMGMGDAQGMRTWFERGVRARFDHMQTYDTMLYALLPRWGGSTDQMLALGRECYATRRFDTLVPYVFIDALVRARRDEAGDMSGWAEPGIYETVADILENMAAHPNHGHKAEFYRTFHAAFAARIGRLPEARKALEAVGERVDTRGALEARFRPDGLRGRIYAYTGPSAAVAQQAARLFADGQLEQAARLYAQAAAVPQEHPLATWFLRSAAQAVRWQMQFDSGEEVALNADKDLIGWEVDRGAWTDEEGWLVGTADSTHIRLGCMASFGSEWEFSTDMHIRTTPARWARTGVFLTQNYGWHWLGCFISPGDRKIVLSGLRIRQQEEGLPLDPDAPVRLVVQRVGGHVNVTVNGRPVFSRHALPRYEPAEAERIAIGGDMVPAGAIIRFRNMRVRKIDHLPGLRIAAEWRPPGVLVPPLLLEVDDALWRKDQAGPADPARQLELADAWWKHAQGQAGRGAEEARHRAGIWYERALPKLAGADKERAADRLRQVPEPCAWDAIRSAAKTELARSGTVGGTGGSPFDDVPANGGILVGFNICNGTVRGEQLVKAIQPIYLTPAGRTAGPWRGRLNPIAGRTVEQPFRVEAHKGYAVGGIVARGGQRVNSFKIIFMRVRGDVLDPADSYETEWLGVPGGGKELRIGNARPVTGIYGKSGEDLDCFGLIQLQP